MAIVARARVCFVISMLGVASAGPTASAQDAGKIVEQYVKASGGSRALEKIRTMTLQGVVAAGADGKPGTYTLHTKLPNRYYSELNFGEKHFVEAYNGKSAWHEDASGSAATLLGRNALQMEAAASFYNAHLCNPKRDKLTIAFAGHAQVRGRDALQLTVTWPTGIQREEFFDAQSHLLVKESAQVAGIDQEILYDDYRAEDGTPLPHKIELHRGTESYAIAVTRAAINDPVGERVFDFPRRAQVQLPDLKALFVEIEKNQKAIDKIKEDYAGTRVEEQTQYDGAGKVKQRELHEYQFFYLDGREFSTLVKKNGVPLSDPEQKKENDAVRKRIEEHQANKAKREAKKEKEAKQKEESKEGDMGIDTFLRACQFVNPRRERFHGQDVLVFDFEPNPDYKPRNLEEKIIQKLAGVVWVDEAAHDVARLEAYFVNDVRIAGGLLANVQKGTSFVFEQAFINNEVWLPTYEEAHLGVRVLLVKGFRVSEVTQYSNYTKFNVRSIAKVAPPQPAAGTPPRQR